MYVLKMKFMDPSKRIPYQSEDIHSGRRLAGELLDEAIARLNAQREQKKAEASKEEHQPKCAIKRN